MLSFLRNIYKVKNWPEFIEIYAFIKIILKKKSNQKVDYRNC